LSEFEENMNRIYDGAGRMARKIGFGRGPAMTPEERNGRVAMLSASLLTLVAIGCGSLGLWRMGADLEWAGDFVIQDGLLSHWQVWVGAVIGMQYTSWWLARYAGARCSVRVET
jgi:hypothetical protein